MSAPPPNASVALFILHSFPFPNFSHPQPTCTDAICEIKKIHKIKKWTCIVCISALQTNQKTHRWSSWVNLMSTTNWRLSNVMGILGMEAGRLALFFFFPRWLWSFLPIRFFSWTWNFIFLHWPRSPFYTWTSENWVDPPAEEDDFCSFHLFFFFFFFTRDFKFVGKCLVDQLKPVMCAINLYFVKSFLRDYFHLSVMLVTRDLFLWRKKKNIL